MFRSPRSPRSVAEVDETTDAWDTVQWLVRNVPGNNGRVGLYGSSYEGWTVLMALLDPHPAVQAAVPVSHGQNWSDGSALSGVRWDQDTALEWRRDELAPFLAHYLKGMPNPNLAHATVFNTGTRQWEHFARWPHPAGVVVKHLYLRAGGTLGWQPPAVNDDSSDRYTSDPAKPVPYQPRPVRRMYDDDAAIRLGAHGSPWISVSLTAAPMYSRSSAIRSNRLLPYAVQLSRI
jgi:predicted acyl esterase